MEKNLKVITQSLDNKHSISVISFIVLLGKVAVGFMQLFISLHGDYTPDSGKIVLSPRINIKDAFCQYKQTYNNDEQIHISRFYELWKKEFPNVIQPKVRKIFNTIIN